MKQTEHQVDEDGYPEDDDASLELDAADAAEEIEIPEGADEDIAMDSDDELANVHAEGDMMVDETLQFQNDSIAHFDAHTSSIFAIAAHPLNPHIIATGGGDDITHIWCSNLTSKPVLAVNETFSGRDSLAAIATLHDHKDSINAVTFSLPSGEFLFTGGLDGQLTVYDSRALASHDQDTSSSSSIRKLASAQEVPEINFLHACPRSQAGYPDAIVALGASDGSVWIHSFDRADSLQTLQVYYFHTASCTAGAWTPDGKFFATVSEDGSFYLLDVFGAGEAAGLRSTGSNSTSQALVAMTAEDQRFAIEGGLYSVAISPSGTLAAIGGAGGIIRVVGLPGIQDATVTTTIRKGAAGGKRPTPNPSSSSSLKGQAGQILASISMQTEGIETLSFAAPPLTLLAAGSVDGSVALFDYAHRYTARRHIKDAHDGHAVVKVEFGQKSTAVPEFLLTTCGLDGAVRQWDVRGGTGASGQGLVAEWKGHRGDGDQGGVLDFVQCRDRIVTAGDDAVALVFDPGQRLA